MLGPRDKVALFGRFRRLPKRRLTQVLRERGALPQRDLTRSSTCLVVGEAALSAFDALEERLAQAARRRLPVLAEARLLAVLSGQTQDNAATLPVSNATAMPMDSVQLLQAFDLITLDDEAVAFQDATTLKSAEALMAEGMALPDMVQALLDKRDSPKGRHRVVVGPDGNAMLAWEDGVTTLSGQHVLPLEEGAHLDDVFEDALDAEAAGDLARAARAFETCAQMDRQDALALFNLGNVQRMMGAEDAAILAYQRALARDPDLAEAHYNLAGVCESVGKLAEAKQHLADAIDADRDFAEAVFNLAQLELQDENLTKARALYTRFLAMAPDPALASKAQKALQLIGLGTQAAP